MSAKHTPGPWRATFGEVAAVLGSDSGRVAIATNLSLHARRDGNEVEANAHLIATAPELLTVAEEVFVLLTTKGVAEVFGQEWCDKAHAAIRKAYGSQP